MARNTLVEEFVERQFEGITINTPRPRQQQSEGTESAAGGSNPVPVKENGTPERRPTGRPKSDTAKTKLSAYVPEEMKVKLQTIQHRTFKSSLNDVVIEALHDIIKKYNLSENNF